MRPVAQAHIQITGTCPLRWYAFGPDTLPLETHERSGVAGNNPEEWRSRKKTSDTVGYLSLRLRSCSCVP
jgi:hypothetical protein